MLWVIAAATMIVGTVVGVAQIERQADAGVFEHRARRLSAAWRWSRPTTSARARCCSTCWPTRSPTSARSASSRCSTTRDRPNDRAARLRRAVERASGAGGADDDLPAVARRLPADGRLHREVVRVQRRDQGRLLLAGDHRRADERRLGLLLPAHRRHDVHDADRRRRRGSRRCRRSPARRWSSRRSSIFYLGILPTRVLDWAAASISTIF